MRQYRGTGRTSRMVAQAIYAAAGNRKVLVVFSTVGQLKDMKDLLTKTAKKNNIPLIYLNNIVLESIDNLRSFDWKAMEAHDFRGRFSVTMVDHGVIEEKFSKALDELYRYNHQDQSEINRVYFDDLRTISN